MYELQGMGPHFTTSGRSLPCWDDDAEFNISAHFLPFLAVPWWPTQHLLQSLVVMNLDNWKIPGKFKKTLGKQLDQCMMFIEFPFSYSTMSNVHECSRCNLQIAGVPTRNDLRFKCTKCWSVDQSLLWPTVWLTQHQHHPEWSLELQFPPHLSWSRKSVSRSDSILWPNSCWLLYSMIPQSLTWMDFKKTWHHHALEIILVLGHLSVTRAAVQIAIPSQMLFFFVPSHPRMSTIKTKWGSLVG